MTAESFDVVVVGAGPAGMSAALQASELGASVVLLDEQQAAGGQIYRNVSNANSQRLELLGTDYAAGRGLTDELARRVAMPSSQLQHFTGAAVWQITPARQVDFLSDGRSHCVHARQIVLATGALERPFPIPGWTLPGAMTAGAGQILLKTAGVVPVGPIVLAGCGPLLYLLAWQYLRAGVKVAAIVDSTTPADHLRAMSHLGGAVRGWRDLAKGIKLLAALRRAGVPFHGGSSRFAIEGEKHVERFAFDNRWGTRQRIEASTIFLHQGVVPHTHITWSVRAEHYWSDAQQCFAPKADEWGELSVAGIRIAGDASGIGGALASAAQGRIAALGAVHACNYIDGAARDSAAAQWRKKLRHHLMVRPFLDALYRAPRAHRLPEDPDVLVCRCEEVTAGTVRAHAALGAQGPNQAKAFSRCGMGPCQGRLCGLTVTGLMAEVHGKPPSEIGFYRVRPPLKPLTVGELADVAAQQVQGSISDQLARAISNNVP